MTPAAGTGDDAGMDAPLAVGGSRLTWHELPPRVRAEVEAAAGSPVRAAASQPGGFSPGLASVLRLAGGRSVFVKAVNTARNPHSPDMYRREAEVLAALPATVPAPRLLWSYDDGDWVVLMTEAADGRPPAHPWRRPELAGFIDLAARLVDLLTPAPMAAPTLQEAFGTSFTGWRRLAAEASTTEASTTEASTTEAGTTEAGAAGRLDPWARRHLDRLADLEQQWPQAAAGHTLLHADLRADNVLLTPRGALVVDWPHACVGAGWADLLFALPSIAMHGGGDPQALWAEYPPAAAADPDAVTVVLAAVVGYFVRQSLRPPPPNLPRLRGFQAAQGEAGLAWLRRRLS